MEVYLHGPLWAPFSRAPLFSCMAFQCLMNVSQTLLPSAPKNVLSLPEFGMYVDCLACLLNLSVQVTVFSMHSRTFPKTGRLVTEGDPTFPNGMWTDPPKCCHRALSLWRSRHVLRGSVTDRRDFYHQPHVTPERARSNMLPFSYPVACFEDTHAYESLKASCLKSTFWPQRSCW